MVMSATKFLWLLRDFAPDYHHAKFGCNWSTNKGETEGACALPLPACVVPNDPSLNRVKSTFTFNLTSFSQIDLR